MRLTHKTTVLLSERLHRQLSQLAAERGQSMGELVRQACERQYGMAGVDARLAAVEALRSMRLPVGPVEQMVAESVADPPNRTARAVVTDQYGSSITLI